MTKSPWRTRNFRVAAALLLAAMLGASAGSIAQAGAGGVPLWSSYDDEIAQANKDKANREQQARNLEYELAETDQAIADASIRLTELNNRLPIVQEEYRVAQERYDAAVLQQNIVAAKLKAARAEDAALTEQIDADDIKINELRNVLAEIARAEYQGSRKDASLSIFFGAQTSTEFVDDYAYRETTSRVQSNTLAQMEELAAVNRNRKARQEAVRAYIEELKVKADALVVETQTARDIAAAKKAEVERLLKDAEDLKAYLESQRETYLAQQRQAEADAAALKAELDVLWKKKLAEEATNGTGSLVKGFLSPPTAVPYITSPYGMRLHPIYRVWKLHAGTDFRAYCGTAILATADGKVEWAKYVAGLGNQVMLYNGVVSGKVLYTSYNHLASFAVGAGQTVKRGQVVGYQGTTGTSTACHQHFEVYVNGSTVDPMKYVADW
ncbi:peptidoglycan DD-metalloendopeptidase family protein [Demequina sp. TTPB684]|uniref:peptidoglycan DD-metalloendopeptidase family protein n=1 Tax=unclassified Demequina TaxID=2620311 RepID=UPI001CF59DC3|nr:MULTISPECIES: M23 family metallopeptidase [unclassified Demequina]MCB2411578.1 peptidoglycan DD-metalloendopeptidase family protein [Demequina sp. TTPB684]UPU87204.1 peptidoglycan DD-metalloendopeptidase family protein [Demequina sp. TMPB413]